MSNIDLIEKNELNEKSQGGTEITTKQIYDSNIAREVLAECQIIPSRVRELDEKKIRVMFFNDLPYDPESVKFKDAAFRSKFHKLVFNSNWQYLQYQMVCGVPYDQTSIVIEPGIVPAPVTCLEKDRDGIIHIAYTSTPQRGLDILIPVFKKLAETDDKIHLHVHSSFKIYGWDDRDKEFEKLFEECQNHPQITYHGFTPHEELKEALNGYHIFGYPSTWVETSCRALLEAGSAGMLCVHPNYGALFDTSGGMTMMYQGASDKNMHASIFLMYLGEAIKRVRSKSPELDFALRFTKSFFDGRFNIISVQKRWEIMLTGLCQQYPDIESRKYPKEATGFNYNSLKNFR